MLCRGGLYIWVTPSKEDKNALQLVIPQSYQKKAQQGCHDDIGHMGLEQMLGYAMGPIILARDDQGCGTLHCEV